LSSLLTSVGSRLLKHSSTHGVTMMRTFKSTISLTETSRLGSLNHFCPSVYLSICWCVCVLSVHLLFSFFICYWFFVVICKPVLQFASKLVPVK
jgi:hypothetical protein